MPTSPDRPLWQCPACGKLFVTPKMWHSCYRGSVDDFFAGRPARLREVYERYLALASSFGPVTVDVAKTRISFQARVRFAGVARARKDTLVLGFWLKHRIDSPRFTKVELIPPADWVYQFVASTPDDIDGEVAGWLEAAYEVGMQRASPPG
jgi:Domain of unknown function (DUF5655)